MSELTQLLNSVACYNKNVFPGATQALFVDVQPGQFYLQIKNIGNTGGLEVLQCSGYSTAFAASVGSSSFNYGTPIFTSGSTLTAAQLVAVSGTGYTMNNNEILVLNGPVRCYLNAPNATCTVALIKGLGTGV